MTAAKRRDSHNVAARPTSRPPRHRPPRFASALSPRTARLGSGGEVRTGAPPYGTLDWRLLIRPSSGFLMVTRAVVVRPGRKIPRMAPGAARYLQMWRTAGWTDAPPEQPLPGAVRR
ncbi:hypothetical protein NE235_25530 [Actinoallomurus spadix]|uniref:Uncharacterized protein n=1 Tax=Actinoallomurus spadix TaxID=79912 RepID=A0ABP3GVP8_9ACTN|nr:hypothetical protein [Actinoallomurus spadix]MCO5989475.1 hypothetical protein [Actinoallomurus spadix]